MNFINKHILRFIAAVSLSVVAASCSQDSLGIAQGGTFLPGECPLKLTATVDEMATRAAETDFWADGDRIRVRIDDTDDYPLRGQYALNADGTVKKAIDALAWHKTDGCVSAWYPYLEDGKTVSIGDQSKGYHTFDFLSAHTEEKNYKDIVDLQFKHQMAKVRCELIKGEGVTDEDLKTAKLSFYGFTTVKFSEKEGISGQGENDWITPASGFEALLVPQDISGKPFITVDLTLTVNNVPIPKTLVYTPEEGKVNLEAGKAYTYKITVQKDRLVVQTISGAWTESKDTTAPESYKYHINLPEEVRGLDLKFSSNVTPMSANTRAGGGEYLLVLGSSFTISYTPDADKCHLGLVFDDKNTKNNMERYTSNGKYVFSYQLSSSVLEPVDLVFGEYVEQGDIYFDDGTWGRGSFEGKIPIGMVFKVGVGNSDNGPDEAKDYYTRIDENGDTIKPFSTIHGYVVALKDAASTYQAWSTKYQRIYSKQIYSGYLPTEAAKKKYNI